MVNEPFQSLAVTNQSLTELLTLGTSLTQTIDGDRKSYSLHYIDWQNPQNNVYHVTDEYSVERRGTHKTSRPDIVLFVNGSMHARMRQVFPHACYIGFTGTPLTKQEKSTAERFGSFIHTYPMREAVADRAVVPLLYEGRMVDQDVDQAQLERWFERTTRHLTDEQRADLKRKMSRSDVLNATEQRIKEIIVDYRGVLGELNEAINTYDALAEYDADDVAGTLTDVSTEIARLPQVHSDLWALFAPVKNKRDAEQMERHLEPEDRRQRFYDLLSDYAHILKLALSSLSFYEEVGDDPIKRYKGDLKFFDGLRRAVKLRYAESVNYRDDYEAKVRKLLDEHIRVTGTSILNEMVNIFGIDRFDEEVARLTRSKAKADTILHRMKRTISLHIDEDPAFYRSFSEMIEEALEAYRQGRLSEAELLEHARSLLADMRSGKASGEPDMLAAYPHAPAYFRSLKAQLDGRDLSEEILARTAIRLEEIVAEYRVTDWTSNGDVQKRMERAIDHQLYDLDKQNNLGLTYAEMDRLIEDALGIAISREKAGR